MLPSADYGGIQRKPIRKCFRLLHPWMLLAQSLQCIRCTGKPYTRDLQYTLKLRMYRGEKKTRKHAAEPSGIRPAAGLLMFRR